MHWIDGIPRGESGGGGGGLGLGLHEAAAPWLVRVGVLLLRLLSALRASVLEPHLNTLNLIHLASMSGCLIICLYICTFVCLSHMTVCLMCLFVLYNCSLSVCLKWLFELYDCLSHMTVCLIWPFVSYECLSYMTVCLIWLFVLYIWTTHENIVWLMWLI